MGTYYYVVNDTKKEILHVDHHIKNGPMRFNSAVHMAIVNYMMDNPEHSIRLLPDNSDSYDFAMGFDGSEPYTEIDLLKYEFSNPEIHSLICLQISIDDAFKKKREQD